MTRCAIGIHERVVFTPNGVIYDCAKSRLLFENKDLLQSIVRSSSPTVIGGVQRRAPGICLDDEETFRNLGTVTLAVGAA